MVIETHGLNITRDAHGLNITREKNLTNDSDIQSIIMLQHYTICISLSLSLKKWIAMQYNFLK